MVIWHNESDTPRCPDNAREGDRVTLWVGSQTAAAGERIWVEYTRAHKEGRPEAFRADGAIHHALGGKHYWKIDLGVFDKGDSVEYIVHGQASGTSVCTLPPKTFTVEALGYEARRVRDPVCGEIVTVRKGLKEHIAAHGLHAYHFCSDMCRVKFEAAPQRYLKSTCAPRVMQAVDIVCGRQLWEEEIHASAEHEGTHYPFCSDSCASVFAEDPHAFVSPGALEAALAAIAAENGREIGVGD
jgi:YHS domain-containing protein